MLNRLLGFLVALMCLQGASAQGLQQRFLQLVQAPGVAGHEAAVRDELRRQLPAWAQPQVDGVGNLRVTLGRGEPHVALVAMLDEPGYVVSRITDDGFLRLHRHTTGPAGVPQPLRDQFMLGQPVVVGTAAGRLVPGVTATPSTHFRRLNSAAEIARLKEVQDLWVDVGATNPAGVAALGIRLLDPVSLRERATPLAQGRVAGVAAQLRGGAQALVELLRGLPGESAVKGTLTVAWVTQSQFGARGLARLARAVQPERALLVAREGGPAEPPPAGWERVAIGRKAVPAQFADTAVETVAVADITRLASELATEMGLAPLADAVETREVADTRPAMASLTPASGTTGAPGASGAAAAKPASDAFQVLRRLTEAYGVAGAEAPVRDIVRSLLPAWATPATDAKGNITVSFGKGGKALLFVAHMDEVGFEITGVLDDGRATVKPLGGVYLSLYEAHPVRVVTAAGLLPALMTPRTGYGAATSAQPELAGLSVYFGTRSAAETRSLGVQEGQTLTVRKALAELAPPRASGRSMDDRVGVTALILALRAIDPARVPNRVTFAFSVDEEVGLGGARALAERLRPDYAFAIDTFVSSQAPLDLQHLAFAPLGSGAVLRGMDGLTLVPPAVIDRITALAAAQRVPLQVGVTQGGTDASVFAARGAVDIGLSWPGRYSHSPVEVMDRRDLEALVRLVGLLVREF
jgi:putative aminopeptidase FrvX